MHLGSLARGRPHTLGARARIWLGADGTGAGAKKHTSLRLSNGTHSSTGANGRTGARHVRPQRATSPGSFGRKSPARAATPRGDRAGLVEEAVDKVCARAWKDTRQLGGRPVEKCVETVRIFCDGIGGRAVREAWGKPGLRRGSRRVRGKPRRSPRTRPEVHTASGGKIPRTDACIRRFSTFRRSLLRLSEILFFRRREARPDPLTHFGTSGGQVQDAGRRRKMPGTGEST